MKILLCCIVFFVMHFCNAQQILVDTTISSQIIRKKVVSNNCNPKTTIKTFIVPVAFISYGFVAQGNNVLKKLDKSAKVSIITNYPNYHTKIDNYLQFTPAVSVYALNMVGIKGKNNFRDRTMLYALSTLISTAIVKPVKYATKVTRPDGSMKNSFPSGHTTMAFASAEFLHQEYKYISPWYGIAGYAIAASTGTLRVFNNKHWVSDVVTGAGFGILSTKLAYWIYPTIKKKIFKNKASSVMFMPYYQSDNAGVAFIYIFKNSK
jgi:hypothetical protein